MRQHVRTLRGRHAIRELAIVATVVLLFLSLAIWTSNSATVEAFNCSGGYHKHVDDDGNKMCHKHCHNGMNDHNRDHGDNCAVNNRPSQPRRRSSNDDDDRGSSPAPALREGRA